MRHLAIARDPPTLGARDVIRALLKVAGVVILLAALLALPAFSQQLPARTLELNTFGRYTDFAAATNLQPGVGGGLRLGYFVHPNWELEGGVGLTRVHRIGGLGTENIVPVLLDVTYNYPIGWYQLLLGGGAVYNHYGSSHAWGTSLSAGARLAFGPTAAIRVDGTREYINKGDSLGRHSNWGFRLGLSWMLPKRHVADERITMRRTEWVATDRTQQLAEGRVAGLPRVELTDRMKTTIHFDVGSSKIRSDAIAALEAKLDLLREIPALRIRIEGQADVRGSNAANISLAWERAGAAKVWLTSRGIASDRIEAVGFSVLRPICEDRYESCGWQNRRAEFVIVAGADDVVQGTP